MKGEKTLKDKRLNRQALPQITIFFMIKVSYSVHLLDKICMTSVYLTAIDKAAGVKTCNLIKSEI